MDIRALDKKIELIQWLSTLEEVEIIKKLMKFRQQETKDWQKSTSTEEQKSIEKGIADAEKKNVHPHSTVKKIYEKWL